MPPRSRAKKVPVEIPEPEVEDIPEAEPEPPAKKRAVSKKKKENEPVAAAPVKKPTTRKKKEIVAPIVVDNEMQEAPDEVEVENMEDIAPHIILQLPIPAERVQEIVSKLEGASDGRADPCPYVPNHYWATSCGSYASPDSSAVAEPILCHWCCHAITANKVGMPIDYDSVHNVFHVYGQFCSLSCAAAYNVSTHMGSDRMWDIHSWIQMMAQVYQLPLPIRPSPSRYVLKMFGGPLSIEEFREAHNNLARTVVLNVPPLVSVQPQVEWVNTSFLAGSGNGLTGDGLADDADTRGKLTRRKSVVDSKRTLESKMNLVIA